jgi:chaperonin GroES
MKFSLFLLTLSLQILSCQAFLLPSVSSSSSSLSAATLSSPPTTATLDGQQISGELQPVGNIILIEVKTAADITSGGIVLPDQAKEKPTEGRCLAVGEGRYHPETGVLMPMEVEAGERVLYGKFDGSAIEYKGLPHTLIRDDDVLLKWKGMGDMTLENVETIRDRILVHVKKPESQTAGGILLAPSMNKVKTCEGTVVKVGPGRIASNGNRAATNLKVNDKVRFREYGGTEVTIGDENYLVMYATDVLAKW